MSKYKEYATRLDAAVRAGAGAEEYNSIYDELLQALVLDGTAKAQDVDLRAVTLMQSGVMDSADYRVMAAEYAENSTMRKLISKYAIEAGDAAQDRYERETLYNIGNECFNSMSDILNAFGELVRFAVDTPERWDCETIRATIKDF